MTHAELSKLLAAALRDCVSAMNNPSMAGDPDKAYRAAGPRRLR
ncbi:hypothetical protein XccvBFoX4_gp78 [Xanthomonas phage FoX4]|uniref:Uncharacterized protein n=1 Tax=Xanthomonas phage FoX4 TaxID=2723900 RepID=A0A858WJ50_9CAUD|nr:hypothetical protein KNU97_gp78 [Xanthomonas phage FoX4]QJI53032.1 hypothetical protein XccvBFoX4_gp78 [Xanthomonas phage FoX4]